MRNYEYLVAVASCGHFGKAAQHCCVTQPTLSLGIKELERQLGFDLIRRERRYLGLTEEGEIVVGYAKRMLKLRASLHSTLDEYRTQDDTPLVFGTVPSGVDLLAQFATRLSQLNLSQSFVTETATKGGIARSVINGDMDLGITHLDECSDDLHVLADLQDDQPFLVAPRGMQPDGPPDCGVDIEDLPICHLSLDYFGAEVRHTLTAREMPRICAGSVRSVVSYLKQQYWYAVVPRGVLDGIMASGQFAARPIETGASAPRLAIVSRPLSTYFGKKLEIIECLRKTAQSYVEKPPLRPCANGPVPMTRNAPLRQQKQLVQDLIETIN
ncbi:LysR family transcriptional regulator [Octadecabacter sp.]|nr:LysR family transcriptional regulator [Octadecabacter sp.]